MGRITLIAALQSNIQAGLQAIGRAATHTGTTIAGMGTRAAGAAGMVGRLNAALIGAQANAAGAAANMARLTGAQHQHGITTGRLIIMMVKFGIILNALRMVTAPLGWMNEGIRSAVVLDKGLRNIVGMLANAGETSQALDERYRRLYSDATRLQTKYGQTTEDVVTGLYKISSVVDSLNFAGVRDVVDKTSYSISYLGNISAQMAVAGMTDIGTAADSLTAVLTGLNIPMMKATEVADVLFQTVRLGKAEFKDVARDMGILAGAFSALTPAGQEMRTLKEAGGLYGFFTTFLPPEEARVSLQRMGMFLTGESKAARELIEGIRDMSGGTVKLRAGEVMQQGLIETFSQIADFVGPDSPYLREFLEGKKGGPVTDQEMQGVTFRILSKIFDDARAARAAMRVLGTEGSAGLKRLMLSMEGFGGAKDRAFGEGNKSISFRFDQLRQSIITTARALSESSLPGMGLMFGGIAQRLDFLQQRPSFKEGSFGKKAGMIFGDLYQAFSEWYYQGGGKTQISEAANRIGTDLGHFIMNVLGISIKDGAGGSQFKSAWYSAGTTAGGEFLRGLINAMNPTAGPSELPGPAAGVQNLFSRGWNSGPMKAIGTFALTKSLGGGNKTSAALGLLAASQDEGAGNLITTALGALGFASLVKGGRARFGRFMGGGPAIGTGAPAVGLRNMPFVAGMTGMLGGLFQGWNNRPGATVGRGPGGRFTRLPAPGPLTGLNKIPGMTAIGRKLPGAIPLIALNSILSGEEDPLKALGRGLFTGAGAIAGTAGMGLLGLPSGPGAILAGLAGGVGGATAGNWLFDRIFGETKPRQAAAGEMYNGSVIDDYFASKNGTMSTGESGGNTFIFQIDKLADNITAATPEEAEQLADRILSRIVAKVEGVVSNNGSRGGGASALITP